MDLRTFNHFVNEYQQRFIRFASTYLRDEMGAEDIVMESFMYYWENRNRLPENVNSPAYVLTTVKHKCIDKLRQQQMGQEVLGDHGELYSWELASRIVTLENFEPHEVFTDEIRLLVEKALGKLPEQTRRIFFMSRYENKTHNEIADSQGMTTKGVEFHISKALKLLRLELKDYLPFSFLFFLS